MANRVATTADTTNTIYTDWITDNIVPYHGTGATMQVGDVIIDDETDNYIRQDWRYQTEWHHKYSGATSGNTSGNTIYVTNGTIDMDLPSEGVFVVEDGSGGFDYYHYGSYSGGTFTLDTVDHPSGLTRTYGGSEDLWGTRFRIGATWWWDGVAMGMTLSGTTTFQWFNILDGNNESWKYASSSNRPVIHRPLRGQVIFGVNGSNGIMFNCSLFDNQIIDGECVAYPGFRDPHKDGEKFLHGTFGFVSWDWADEGSHCFSFDYGNNAYDKPSYKIYGCEAIGAFSGFRVCQGGTNKDIEVRTVEIRRSYRHDAEGGEGLYWGTTSGSNEPKFLEIIVEDNIFARCAAETIQVEEQINGSFNCRYKNNTIIGGASDFISPFQSSQNNTWQVNFGDGNVLVSKNITAGSSDNAIIQFGNSLGSGQGTIKWKDNLFMDNRFWLYIHNSTLNLTGLTFDWQRMYIIRHSDRYLRGLTQTSVPSSCLGNNNGDSIWKLKQVYNDSSGPTLHSTPTDFEIALNGEDDTIPVPEFVNSGFNYGMSGGTAGKYDFLGQFAKTRYNSDYNGRTISSIIDNGSGKIRVNLNNAHKLVDGDSVILHGTDNYDGYYPSGLKKIDVDTYDLTGVTFITGETSISYASDTPPIYYLDEIVSFPNPILGMSFYKCLADPSFEINSWTYDLTGDTSNWSRIYWDSGGTRSDMTGYTGSPDPRTGGNFPPDDLRLETDSYWSSRGLGVRWQEHYDGYEKYRWYVADDADGTNKTLIPEAKENKIDIYDPAFSWVSSLMGKYLIGSVQLVTSGLTLGSEVFSTGTLIIPLPSPSPTPSITPSITPTITPSITPSITVSPSVTPSITPSITPTITPSITVSPSITPSPTPTPSSTPFNPLSISWYSAAIPSSIDQQTDGAVVSGWTNEGSGTNDLVGFNTPIYNSGTTSVRCTDGDVDNFTWGGFSGGSSGDQFEVCMVVNLESHTHFGQIASITSTVYMQTRTGAVSTAIGCDFRCDSYQILTGGTGTAFVDYYPVGEWVFIDWVWTGGTGSQVYFNNETEPHTNSNTGTIGTGVGRLNSGINQNNPHDTSIKYWFVTARGTILTAQERADMRQWAIDNNLFDTTI